MRARMPSQRALRFALPGLLVILAILIGWWQPWRSQPATGPRPVALVPTPTPIALTPTLPPQRVAPPPVAPLDTVPRATAAASHTATAAAPGPAGATGTLLYIGRHDGQEGIVAVNADGTNRRLLTVGQYEALSWSPDGTRLAAVGPLQVGLTSQVAIFTPEGRALARYPFEGVVGRKLIWSPDGTKLAGNVTLSGESVGGREPQTEAWSIPPQGGVRRAAVPDRRVVSPFAWTPLGTLLVVSYDESAQQSLWLVSDDSSTVVQIFSGPYIPLALGRDGETLYALSIFAQNRDSQLVAIDLRAGQPTVVADANRVGAAVDGAPTPPERYAFAAATIAPDERYLAVVVQRIVRIGQPASGPTLPDRLLIVMRLDSLIVAVAGVARLSPGAWPENFAWSPDYSLLAFSSTGNATGHELIVVDRAGVQRATIPYYQSSLYGGMNLGWSPDGRWLAYASIAGIGLLGLDGDSRAELASPGGFPTWRPSGRP